MTELTTPYGPHGPPRGTPAHDYEADERLLARPQWRRDLYRIIFEHDTPTGMLFDVLVIAFILASVVVVMIESVETIAVRHGSVLRVVEWAFTGAFTVEYVTRLLAARRPGRYARSFFGVIDFLAILPSFLGLIVPGGQALAVVRVLRVLRIFRVLKLAQFVASEKFMLRALRQSGYKVAVFLIAVITIVMVLGAIMYIVEGPANGFTSIPIGVYWAIVTVTTVGFGDITPATTLGQMLAAVLMILGYGMIAVPTGIVTAAMVSPTKVPGSTQMPRPCPGCSAPDHDRDASYCKRCGADLTALP